MKEDNRRAYSRTAHGADDNLKRRKLQKMIILEKLAKKIIVDLSEKHDNTTEACENYNSRCASEKKDDNKRSAFELLRLNSPIPTKVDDV